MTSAILAPRPSTRQPLSISSEQLAEISGKEHTEVLRTVALSISAAYSPDFVSRIREKDSQGIRREDTSDGGYRLMLQKRYVLYILHKFGNEAAYAAVDKALSFTDEEQDFIKSDAFVSVEHSILGNLGEHAFTQGVMYEEARQQRCERESLISEMEDEARAAAVSKVVSEVKGQAPAESNTSIPKSDTHLALVDKATKDAAAYIYLNTDFGDPKPGYIYAIEGFGKVKIGMSKTPYLRVKNQYTSGGGYPRVFVSNPVFNRYIVESTLHGVLESERTFGEWFRLPLDLIVDVITRVASEFPANPNETEHDMLCRMEYEEKEKMANLGRYLCRDQADHNMLVFKQDKRAVKVPHG